MRWIFVLAIGCGHPAPTDKRPTPAPAPVDAAVTTAPVEPKPLDQDFDRLAEKSLVLLEEMGAAFAAAGESCADAITRLAALAAKHADVIAATAKVVHDGNHLKLKIALRRFDDRARKAAQSLVQSKTVAACAEDVAFRAAFDRIASPPSPAG